jgi:hypothetical protein
MDKLAFLGIGNYTQENYEADLRSLKDVLGVKEENLNIETNLTNPESTEDEKWYSKYFKTQSVDEPILDETNDSNETLEGINNSLVGVNTNTDNSSRYLETVSDRTTSLDLMFKSFKGGMPEAIKNISSTMDNIYSLINGTNSTINNSLPVNNLLLQPQNINTNASNKYIGGNTTISNNITVKIEGMVVREEADLDLLAVKFSEKLNDSNFGYNNTKINIEQEHYKL